MLELGLIEHQWTHDYGIMIRRMEGYVAIIVGIESAGSWSRWCRRAVLRLSWCLLVPSVRGVGSHSSRVDVLGGYCLYDRRLCCYRRRGHLVLRNDCLLVALQLVDKFVYLLVRVLFVRIEQ